MKKIVIIGGGIAGLTAGVYAQKAGFESVILEKNAVPGGECTGWDRQGCHIDGCIHWMCGTKPGSDMYDTWCAVGALGGDIEIIDLPALWSYSFGGKSVTLWSDLDRVQKEMIELSPEDETEIRDFISDARSVSSMEMPTKVPVDMMKLGELISIGMKMKGAGGVMSRKGKLSCEEYAKRFHNPVLGKFFSSSMPEGYSVSSMIFSMGMFASGQAGIPRGGSRAMALRMAAKYESLGGELRLSTPVCEIIVQNGQASGVKLSNGETVNGDYVLAACDAAFTLNKLLGGKYKIKELDARFKDEVNYPSPTSLMISYCVDEDISDMPVIYNFECEPYELCGRSMTFAGIHHYGFEKSFAPERKTVATSTITLTDGDFRYFDKLYEDKAAYQAEKERIARVIGERIEKELPRLKDKLSVIDVATPMTYARYCNAYHGAWMSFMMTPGSKPMMHKGNIKGLKNCFLTGQWLMPPGGLPTALSTGKASIQRITKREGLNYLF